mmetsp:Transcript_73501/g.172403  ORF Transcript_73501/g.172403 Transcript_73501/m.172403 type:complete len:148 (-) Transcript_73501:299-742(-)
MGRLRTVFCRSGREVCMHVDEENTTVRELRSQVLSTLGRVEANAKQAVSGCAGMMCLVSNEHVADLLGLTADVLVPPSGFCDSSLLQPWSFESIVVRLGSLKASDADSAHSECVRSRCLQPTNFWGVEAISVLESRYGQGYIVFGFD